jgi:hypothetical protein
MRAEEHRMKQLAVAALAAVCLGLAGCGGAVAGQPSAGGPSSDGGSVRPTGESAAPSSTGSSQLTDQPCSLLSSSDLEQLNASSPPSAGMSGPDHACDLITGSGAVEVAVVEGQGLAQATFQGPTTPETIGRHQAVKYPEPNDDAGCFVGIAVTDSSRVDVETEATDLNPADPCAFTRQVATLVEPHLPAS